MSSSLSRRAHLRARRTLGLCLGVFASVPLSSFPLLPPTGRDEPNSMGSTRTSEGARVYARACTACHGTDGGGRSPFVPPLRGSRWLNQSSNEALAAVLLHGIAGPLGPGRPAPGVMPGFGLWLDDAQLAEVGSFVREEFSHRFQPLLPGTVTKVRMWDPSRSMPWTWPELTHTIGQRVAATARSGHAKNFIKPHSKSPP